MRNRNWWETVSLHWQNFSQECFLDSLAFAIYISTTEPFWNIHRNTDTHTRAHIHKHTHACAHTHTHTLRESSTCYPVGQPPVWPWWKWTGIPSCWDNLCTRAASAAPTWTDLAVTDRHAVIFNTWQSQVPAVIKFNTWKPQIYLSYLIPGSYRDTCCHI